MGRIFEKRKLTMFARWDRVAKQFTRIAKEIAIAVKSGTAEPESNPVLRRAMQNARAANMPKDRVEAAIRRAAGQDAPAYEEILYEGYAPHGVAILVECATDNPTRTVANVRSHFKVAGGNMGTVGSVAFQFQRKGVFVLDATALAETGIDPDDLELDLIDHGLDEMVESAGEKNEPQFILRSTFGDLGRLQRALEERSIKPLSAGSAYVATGPLGLPDDKAAEVLALVDSLEQDDDVQRVSHNLA